MAVLTVLAILISGGDIRQPLFDLYQRLTPAAAAPSKAQVVLIDAPSLAAVGGWPWSRYVMARLTEAIASRGAEAIGFDFLFPEPDRTTPGLFADLYPELPPATAAEIRKLPSMDAVFARVIGRSPVVLARAGVDQGSVDAVGADAPLPPEAQFAGAVPVGLPIYPQAVVNLPLLDGAALGHGLVNGPKDPDGATRRVPLLAKAAGALTPGLALELVRVAEGEDGAALISRAGRLQAVQLGRHRLPTDAQGDLALRFRGLPGSAITSAADLLRSGVPAKAFAGKIVLVGLTAAGTSDLVTTPLQTQTYGVLVQAEAVNAIAGAGGLDRPDWAPLLEWGLGLAMALAAWWLTPSLGLRAMAAGAVGLGVLVVGGSYLAFLRGLLLDPTPVLGPGVATAAGMVAVLFVEGRRAQTQLRAALDEERLSAAKIAGELSAASEIQSGMLLPRAALRRVCGAVEIDAVLQPARSVGGDLYDAFMIDPGRLCFLVGDVTGKGVPASLFMALSKALSRSFLMRPQLGLDAALDGINAELSRDNGQMMAVSLLVGVLDLADGTLDLVSAGHENPLLVDAQGAVRELRLDGGPALCVVEDFPYPVERHALAPGETLVCFTDGVTEAQDPQGQLFDRARAMAVVGGPPRPLPQTVDALVAAVRAFEAGQEASDDLTVLAVRRL
ncbi:CHASE2 domain-containing protein [Phenylobacterium sp.]|uniref:CHASE2 domain-containing protein n=1 Tax=Phenylobacterium sp. TaxID=1871053 RepID=UPI0011F58184|nr:CHASE2 domain-containing protein [Phenylobacterium sp.]THD59439.1 MAG: CHASE2 domain-containing protein [Phenylobacterium sp.]